MTQKKQIKLNDAEKSVLPFIPLILCAKADGGISPEEQRVILEAVRTSGIDIRDQSLKLFVELMETDLSKIEFTYLYAIKDLIDDIQEDYENVSIDSIMQWSAKVCASTYERGQSNVSEKESAMLRTVAEKLGITDFKDKVVHLEQLIGDNIPALASHEIHEKLKTVIKDMPEDDIESKPEKRKFGRLFGFLPWEGIRLEHENIEHYNKKDFLQYLAGSVALSKREKKVIIGMFKSLSHFQITELIKIFMEERDKFNKLSEKHAIMVYKQEYKHYLEWLELYEEISEK